MTTFRDGTKEEGKYKYNVLITSQKKKHLFLIRSAKFRERIEAAVSSSQRASKYALQKADIAVSRTATARSKAEMAESIGDSARVDSEIAVATAREFAPDFKPSVLERFERLRVRDRYRSPNEPQPSHQPAVMAHGKSFATSNSTTPNHIAADNSRTAASTDSTPQKQISFPQASLRRQSMLQKQSSVDYPGTYPTGVLPQHTLVNTFFLSYGMRMSNFNFQQFFLSINSFRYNNRHSISQNRTKIKHTGTITIMLNQPIHRITIKVIITRQIHSNSIIATT